MILWSSVEGQIAMIVKNLLSTYSKHLCVVYYSTFKAPINANTWIEDAILLAVCQRQEVSKSKIPMLGSYNMKTLKASNIYKPKPYQISFST
jgi:hypothetical protein